MTDKKSIREFVSARTGASWFSLLIEPERDGSGSPVTIQSQYIGRDETANYLQTKELPEAEARALYEILLHRFHAAGGRHLYTKPDGSRVGVVRMSIENADQLTKNSEFIEATSDASLLDQIRNGALKSWVAATDTTASTPSHPQKS